MMSTEIREWLLWFTNTSDLRTVLSETEAQPAKNLTPTRLGIIYASTFSSSVKYTSQSIFWGRTQNHLSHCMNKAYLLQLEQQKSLLIRNISGHCWVLGVNTEVTVNILTLFTLTNVNWSLLPVSHLCTSGIIDLLVPTVHEGKWFAKPPCITNKTKPVCTVPYTVYRVRHEFWITDNQHQFQLLQNFIQECILDMFFTSGW